jgi:hypothetical protein
MTMTKTALLFWTADLGHLGVLVIALLRSEAANGDDQDTQMTKIGRPKKEGDLAHGHGFHLPGSGAWQGGPELIDCPQTCCRRRGGSWRLSINL